MPLRSRRISWKEWLHLTTFEKLKELSDHLKEVKTTLAVAPISEIAANQDLITTFNLIANLRMVIVTAAQ